MNTWIAVACLVPGLALAQGMKHGGSINGVGVTTGAQTFSGQKTFSNGIKTDNVLSATANPITLTSSVADGATAIGITLNTSVTMATAGSKLLSLQNNGAEQLSVDRNGIVYPTGVTTVGNVKAGGFWQNNSSTLYLTGQVADGATAIAAAIDNQTTLANATAKLFAVRNNTVEKFYIDLNGTVCANAGFSNPGHTSNQLGLQFSGSNLALNAGGDTYTVIIRSNTGLGFGVFGSSGLDLTANAAARLTYAATDTSATPGAATVNKPSGQAAVASAASSVVITNSNIAATSIVTAVLQANDSTCTSVKSVIPATGSFTVTLNAACTGATKFGWYQVN